MDLEQQLDSLFATLPNAAQGEEKRCDMKDLPRLVERFEKERGVVLLLDDEKDALKQFTEQSHSMAVTASELVPLFAMLSKSQAEVSPASKELPPIPELQRRPLSIGSFESDGSSAGEAIELVDEGSMDSPQPSLDRSPFPRSQSEPEGMEAIMQSRPADKASRIPRSHTRSQTVPHPLNLIATESPSTKSPTLWSTRQRSAPLDSIAIEQSRRPVSRRAATAKVRKQSADDSLSSSTSSVSPRSSSAVSSSTPLTSPDTGDRSLSPFNLSQGFDSPSAFKSAIPRRHKSNTPSQTPTMPQFPRSHSARRLISDEKEEQDPSPPSAQINTDAFHVMPTSPKNELDASSPAANINEAPFKVMFENPLGSISSHGLSRQASTASTNSGHTSEGSNTMSRPTSLFVGEGFGNSALGGFALRPDSIASLNSLGTLTGDEVSQMIRIVHDSEKKYKEAERRLQAQGEDHDQALISLQAQLDDALADSAARRKEEKELRIKEKQSRDAIATLEAELSKVQSSLKSQRELYNNT